MKRILFATAALLALATTPVMADVIDPLHGTCLVGCVANAGPPPNISIPNPPLNFGFQASPGQLGPPPGGLTMDFLVPIAVDSAYTQGRADGSRVNRTCR